MTGIQDLMPVSSQPRNMGPSTLATSDEFMRILTAQLANQDPLEPVDQAQFLSQLAQFSELEQTISTNQHLAAIALLQENLAAIQQMTEGSGLIGQKVEFIDPVDGSSRGGEVTAIRVEDGLVVLDVEGTSVPLPLITAVLGYPPEEEDGA